MRRIAAIALIFCAGCAEYRQDCLLQDSFVGDVCRCLTPHHSDATATSSSPPLAAPVATEPTPMTTLPPPSSTLSTPAPFPSGTNAAPMNKVP